MRFNFTRYTLVAMLVSLVLCVTVSYAGSDAAVTGLITDHSGAVVPGATVVFTRINTNVPYTTQTNGVGIYSLPSLLPGVYRANVSKDGFKSIVKGDIELHVQDQLSINFELQVGSVSESITVEGGAPMLNTESATVSTVVNRQFVENIPLNGRSFESLIMLSPGVVATKASFAEQGQFSINGQRADANYYTVDGVSANFSINAGGGTGQAGAGLLPAVSTTGGFNNLVSVDALQEFRIQTSTYAPEFGRTPGGQISMVTRSGTNTFHGSVFDYLRNDILDANDWFANKGGLRKPRERQNDFGGVFGGPVVIPGLYNGRDRTFFFFSYEGLRLTVPTVATSYVPSIAVRQSAPAAVQAVLNAFPIPNGAALSTGLAPFTASFSNPTSVNATSFRVDHVFSNKVTIFARYNFSPSSILSRGASGALSNYTPTLFDTKTLTLGTTWAISSTMNNEFRANLSRQYGETSLVSDNFGGAVPLTAAMLPPFANYQNTFLSFYVINTSTTSVRSGRNGAGRQRQLNFLDNFTIVKGSHQLKVGVDYRHLSPSAYSRSYDLQYIFASPAAIALGQVSLLTVNRRGEEDYAYDNYSLYAQDTWKPTPRLTLTYGVRWDVNPAPHGRNGTVLYAANQIDNLSTLAFAPAGTPLWETTYRNFAPRFGIAYQPGKSGSTVLRGGFGMFYDMPAGAISNVVILSPNVLSGTTIVTTYPPSTATILAAIPPLTTTGPYSNVMVTDPHLQLPYALEWNVALEHSFGSKQIVSASYVGSGGHRLIRQDSFTNTSVNFPTLTINDNRAVSNYNAMQLQYQRHLSHGLQVLASYTWSHSIDTNSNNSTALPGSSTIDLSQERGPSDFDIRHSFSGALTYDFPTPKIGGKAGEAVLGHWAVESLFAARTALPVNVTVSRNLGYGIYSFRPDLVAGVPFYLTDTTVGGGTRFNNTMVAGNPTQVGPFLVNTGAIRQGALGRNAMRGFGMNQLNFALRRQFNFTERFNMQFRAECFNLLNHPNFSDPAGSLGTLSTANVLTPSPTFGVSPSMLNQSMGTGGQSGGFNPLYNIGGPRSIQLSLRFAF
jgi:hypothetical protein